MAWYWVFLIPSIAAGGDVRRRLRDGEGPAVAGRVRRPRHRRRDVEGRRQGQAGGLRVPGPARLHEPGHPDDHRRRVLHGVRAPGRGALVRAVPEGSAPDRRTARRCSRSPRPASPSAASSAGCCAATCRTTCSGRGGRRWRSSSTSDRSSRCCCSAAATSPVLAALLIPFTCMWIFGVHGMLSATSAMDFGGTKAAATVAGHLRRRAVPRVGPDRLRARRRARQVRLGRVDVDDHPVLGHRRAADDAPVERDAAAEAGGADGVASVRIVASSAWRLRSQPTAMLTVELHRHFEAGPDARDDRPAGRAAPRHRGAHARRALSVAASIRRTPRRSARYYASIAAGFGLPDGFTRFHQSFGLPLSVLRTLEDLEQAAFEQVVWCAERGSLHTELRGSPFTLPGTRRARPLEEIARGARERRGPRVARTRRERDVHPRVQPTEGHRPRRTRRPRCARPSRSRASPPASTAPTARSASTSPAFRKRRGRRACSSARWRPPAKPACR